MEAKPVANSVVPSGADLGWLAAGIGLGVLGAIGVHKLLRKSQQTSSPPLSAHEAFRQQIGDSSQAEFAESLMREQLVRNYQFFGDTKQEQIRKSFVIVVGVGGVGSHVVN